MKRKICVFTGTRAEYGLLKPLMDKIKNDGALKLEILASGMHLAPEFGLTYREIENDRFRIDEKIEILSGSDTPVELCRSMGRGLAGFGEAYQRLKPDIVVILGDRFEAFAAASAAMISKIPIAHISGGEATFGLIDEAIRHSITKMSHLHFTSTEEYRKRVIKLGENTKSVFNVGAIGLDNIRELKLLTKKSLEKKLRFKFDKKNLLVTFHPVTLEKDTSKEQFQNLLDELNNLKDTHIIFTKANADTGGKIINKMIDKYVSGNSLKAAAFISMGFLKFLSTMQFVDAVVGNSSSGIIEAPSFKIGTINIGDRQDGRMKAKSTIDCKPSRKDIRRAFRKLYCKEFQNVLKDVKNSYADGNSSERIKKILKTYTIDGILKKVFYDLNHEK